MIGRPEYTLSLPPPCPTNRDHLKPRCEECTRVAHVLDGCFSFAGDCLGNGCGVR